MLLMEGGVPYFIISGCLFRPLFPIPFPSPPFGTSSDLRKAFSVALHSIDRQQTIHCDEVPARHGVLVQRPALFGRKKAKRSNYLERSKTGP